MRAHTRTHLLTTAMLVAMAGGVACKERNTDTTKKAAAPAAPATKVQGVTDTTIKIGSFGPLSGPAAVWGDVLRGMEAYFAHINEKGGIHGRKIEFVYRDDQYSPAKTPGVVRELVEKEQVFAIVGGVGTANGRAVADYLDQKGIPFFTPASGVEYFSSGKKKNIYTVFPRYLTEGQILGEYISKELKSLKVGVLYQDDDFGAQGAQGLENGLKKFGGNLAFKVSCLPTDTNLSGQVSQIVEKEPEVLVLFTAPRQAIMAVKQLATMKKKPHILTSFVLADPIMFKLATPELWEGTITSSAMKLPDGDDPVAVAYREVLVKHGKENLRVGNFSLAGFAFAVPFVEALQRAGKDVTPQKVYEALETLKDYSGTGPHMPEGGFGPPITFGPDRRLGHDRVFLARAEKGKWVKVSDWLSLEEGK